MPRKTVDSTKPDNPLEPRCVDALKTVSEGNFLNGVAVMLTDIHGNYAFMSNMTPALMRFWLQRILAGMVEKGK